MARRSLIAFFVLTYALTWAMFITVAVAVLASTPLGYGLVLVGAFAPAIFALLLTASETGAAGAQALLGRIAITDVPIRWYVFALTFMAGVKLSAAVQSCARID